MLGEAKRIYLATRKKHDQLFNTYLMRPLAGGVVALLARTAITPNQVTLLNLAVFVVAAALLVALPTAAGGLVAVAVLELSYLLDCADGMLARHKQLASKEGHLFDFFTDELKAVLLSGALSMRLFSAGGLGLDGGRWPGGDPRFLLAGVVGVAVIASAISLTNFVRRPEISGKETSVSAYYETATEERPRSPAARAAGLVMTFLRFLNHYPSHIWAFALADRLDVFFWMYVLINLLYLAKGWLGLLLRFGRS
ncbi:putative membrane protein [Sorangium cellulosum So ce56]|uniref:Membrane protein n=1 Tax=Sorangium cellulosum (strain So ce56) TaxID=448385 RepID=A9GB49_SORC5|nr:CDP-alcohol phosphatidyltransferase family protein [Sorangium cellulosum]CAN92956.1 putative membrane protein [Sorangium cellulosum So ce56]